MIYTNEQKIAREEIIETTNQLIRLCQKHNMAVSGFVWGTDAPMIFSFGNTKEQKDIPALSQMYLQLCDTVENRMIEGTVETRCADKTQ